MSSLTIFFGYIATCMLLYVFFHYKFLKILDVCTVFCLRHVPANKAAAVAAAAAVVHRAAAQKGDGPMGHAAAAQQQPAAPAPRSRTVWDIPGPAVLPLLGTKWVFLWKYSMTQLHKVYAEFARTYGPIVLEVTPSGVPIVLLFERADIEKVLRYPSRYPFRPPTEIVSTYRTSRPDRYASVGITNEQGTRWHHLRSKLTPAITSPRVLHAFLPALNEICDDFVELLRRKRCPKTGEVANFQDVANLMGLEAVCTLMLGRRMGFLSERPAAEVQRLAAAVKLLFVTQRDSTYGFGLWRYMATKTWRDFSESEELIYATISEIVDRTMAEHAENAAAAGADASQQQNTVHSVFLSILNEPQLDIREKKSAIIDFISAGIETLANTLSFILYYTTLERRTQDGIYAEFRHCPDAQISVDDLSAAAYTKACVQETYRLTPTAFCLARILEEDATLSGYDLKAGTVVLCQTMHACNNDANFAQAAQFRPERWLNADRPAAAATATATAAAKCQSDAAAAALVVPFGIGRRTCPGRRFVELELTMLLAKMVRRFDIDYCGELQTEFEFLLVPRSPVGLRLRDRLTQ